MSSPQNRPAGQWPPGYPQPPSGYMPVYQPPGNQKPPPQPPRKSWPARHKVLVGLGALTALIIVIVIAANSGGGSTPAPASHAPAGNAPASAGIGTPVRDGQFQFVVTAVTYTTQIGGQFGETAQGHFAVLHLAVKNIGSQSQTLDDSAQYVYANGHRYSADSMADIAANSTANSTFFNDINPGNTVHGVIAFDMPSNVKPSRAVLHDSSLSDGVSVNLTR